MPEKPRYVRDKFIGFPGGVNSGVAPSLLPPDQLARAYNASVRGGYVTPRSTYQEIAIDFQDSEVLRARFEEGKFQGADFYLADDGTGLLLSAIGGRLFRLNVSQPSVVCQEVTVSFNTATSFAFVAPAVGGVVSVTVASTTNMSAGAEIVLGGKNYRIISIDSPVTITVQNIDDNPGTVHAAPTILQYFDLNPASRPMVWMQQAERWMIVQDGQSVPIFFDGASSVRSNPIGGNPQISAGRQMAYWLGRLWWVNPDGRTFRAGDLVYSDLSLGRASVLYQTDNTFLGNGGNFTVPSNGGQITAMRPVNVLDNSLGQGPLQVSTASMVFGCTASTDSTEWQNTNDPILGVSQIESGALSHWSTVLANGDMFYRSVNGIQSLVMGRREFNVWGNVPQSQEMNYILDKDNESLLQFSSAIVFDNRLLMTAGPIPTQRGVYHRGVVALDFDIISSMRNKLPPVYDGIWTGLQPLKLIKGIFGNTERAFAFCLSTAGTIKLFELLAQGEATEDNGDTAIIWAFETGDLFKKSGIGAGEKIRLDDGILFVDEYTGLVSFQVHFRPDQSSCWIPWNNFSICTKTCQQAADPYECLEEPFATPQYKNELGLGQPPSLCDPDTDSPYREGYTFQVRVRVTGNVRIKSMQFRGVVVDEPECPRPMCQNECFTPVVHESYRQSIGCEDPLATLTNISATLPTGFSITGNQLVVAAGTYTSTVSKAHATQLAWKALSHFFRTNLATGDLACVGLTWQCVGAYLNDAGETVDLETDCSNALPGVTSNDLAFDINPTLPIYDDICDVTPVHASLCSDMGLLLPFGSIGPFDVPKTVNFGGAYHVVSPASSPAGGCPINEIFVRVQVFNLDGGDQEFYLNTADDLGTGFDVSGVWSISGTLPVGAVLVINATVGVIAKFDAGIIVPPVAQLTMTTGTIT